MNLGLLLSVLYFNNTNHCNLFFVHFVLIKTVCIVAASY